MRRGLAIGACGVMLAAPGSAWAAGGPVPPVLGGAGASAPGGGVGYVAMARGGGTVVQRVDTATGSVESSRLLRARLGVPGATFEGATTGLSADGRTLVLEQRWRVYPSSPTRLVVVDARRLRVRARLALAGSFAVDAISPDGRWLYLLHYRSANNPLNYEVRAYDLRARRLLRAPIVDPREPDEKMVGIPTTRTTSADGRWVYTLYMRPEKPPFVHALDTVGRRAHCVDLKTLTGSLDGVRLHLDGGTLQVISAAGPQALVDRRTFAVRRPTPPAAAQVRPRPAAVQPADGGGTPWWPFAAFGALAAAAVAVAAGLRAARRAAPEVVRTASPDSHGRA
jgi:hypothetical protein